MTLLCYKISYSSIIVCYIQLTYRFYSYYSIFISFLFLFLMFALFCIHLYMMSIFINRYLHQVLKSH